MATYGDARAFVLSCGVGRWLADFVQVDTLGADFLKVDTLGGRGVSPHSPRLRCCALRGQRSGFWVWAGGWGVRRTGVRFKGLGFGV